MARDFDRQVAELQIHAALLNRFTYLGTPNDSCYSIKLFWAGEAWNKFDLRNKADRQDKSIAMDKIFFISLFDQITANPGLFTMSLTHRRRQSYRPLRSTNHRCCHCYSSHCCHRKKRCTV